MKRHVFAGALVALLLPLAGCGGDAPTGAAQTSAPASADERMRRFAACMRENGVEVEDPEPGGTVRLGEGAGSEDPEKMEAARTACRSLLPDGGTPTRLSGEDLEKARAMAGCMREHGVDVPDPDPDKGGAVSLPRGGAGGGDPKKSQAAFEACRHLGPQVGR